MSKVTAIPVSDSQVASVYEASDWAEVLLYHESDDPGVILVSFSRGSLRSDQNALSLPKQTAFPAIRVAPGDKITAKSSSGNRKLQIVEMPLPPSERAMARLVGLLEPLIAKLLRR